ncbi:MAG: NfeD family protein [Bacteroidales bacterium]|nr:NfeD family protein [Bacteroidales bacterium]
MSWPILISVALLGLLLVALEIVALPGGISGVLGALLAAAAIALSFKTYGYWAGIIMLLSSILIVVVLLIIFMKSKTWRRVSLDTEIDGRANEVTIAVGDEGKTISRLAPAGKALIKGQVVEVHTVSDYLDTDVPVKVIEVDGYRIIVERN